MSDNDKMGWDEKSYYITLVLGGIVFVWCVVDFDSLAAVVNAPITAVIASLVVGGALLGFIAYATLPYILQLFEQRKNDLLKQKLASIGRKTTVKVMDLKKTIAVIEDCPLVRVTVEINDHTKKTFLILAKTSDYSTKPGDKITVLYNPDNLSEMIPVNELD